VSEPSYPTRSSEANALLALQNGDHDEAEQHLADYLPNELAQLEDAADALSALCARLRRQRRTVSAR
jgi:phage shock protein A